VEAACCVVLYEGRNGQLIGLHNFMARADFLSGTRRHFQFNGGEGRRKSRHPQGVFSKLVVRDL
jgi:hypothetical protein